MRAEIISIGDEILIGQTVNTNAAWIGTELSKLGFTVERIVAVADTRDSIMKALGEASGRVDAALITGGLGPTSDDITKPVLCDFFGTHLVPDQKVLEMITTMIRKRNFQMNENNRRQADVPESCRVLYNATGTAPGMWFEKDGTIFVSMPGVPLEMKHIMSEHVLPELEKRFRTQVIVHKNIMVYGISEAKLAEMLTGFEAGLPQSVRLAYLPSFGIIKLRLTGKGNDRGSIVKDISHQVTRLYEEIGELIYAEDEESMEITVGRLLADQCTTLCTAESCTGGNIARMITSVPGSSKYFIGSLVAYSNRVKEAQLYVPPSLIEEHGAVSIEVAEAMSKGARKLFGTDYSLAITGIAGPDGGTEMKPVGTVCISVDSVKGNVVEKFNYGSGRDINIMRFSVAALNMLRRQILKAV